MILSIGFRRRSFGFAHENTNKVTHKTLILLPRVCTHTGQCKRTGGCYNELVVAFFSTCGGVKGKKIYTC